MGIASFLILVLIKGVLYTNKYQVSDPPLGGVLYAGGYYSEGGYYMPVYTVLG